MSWGGQVLDTVAAEFSDVGDVTQLTRIVVRLMLAAVIGFMLGFEREQQGKDEHQVQGLTTAAGLWMTAAIGMACGLGREVTAVLSALLALAVLALVPRLVDMVERMVGPPRIEDDKAGNAPRVIASPEDDQPPPR